MITLARKAVMAGAAWCRALAFVALLAGAANTLVAVEVEGQLRPAQSSGAGDHPAAAPARVSQMKVGSWAAVGGVEPGEVTGGAAAVAVVPAMPAAIRVQLSLAPVSTGPTDAVLGKGPRIGLWNGQACQDGTGTLVLPMERVYLAFWRIPFLTKEQVRAVVGVKKKSTRWSRIKTALDVAGIGVVAARPRNPWVLLVGTGLGTLMEIVQKREPETEGVTAEAAQDRALVLPPGGCARWTAAASLVRDARAERVEIEVPMGKGDN